MFPFDDVIMRTDFLIFQISRLCLLSLLVGVSLAMRAFPLASEEYVIKLFETINENIVSDYSGVWALMRLKPTTNWLGGQELNCSS